MYGSSQSWKKQRFETAYDTIQGLINLHSRIASYCHSKVVLGWCDRLSIHYSLIFLHKSRSLRLSTPTLLRRSSPQASTGLCAASLCVGGPKTESFDTVGCHGALLHDHHRDDFMVTFFGGGSSMKQPDTVGVKISLFMKEWQSK